MIFGQLSIPLVQKIASQLWHDPVESEEGRFYFVEVIGAVKSFHIPTVCCFIIRNIKILNKMTNDDDNSRV